MVWYNVPSMINQMESPAAHQSIDPASAPAEMDFPLNQRADLEGDLGPLCPLPSLVTSSPLYKSSPLTPVVCDERVISRLLEILLNRAGLSISEAARRMGNGPNTISQYINKRRCRPSLLWFIKFAELCGAKVTIELPGK